MSETILHVCETALPATAKVEVKSNDGSHLIGGLHARLYNSRMRKLYDIDALYTDVLNRIAPFEGGGVLDVGCGTGALLFSLQNRYPCASTLAGIDASYDMLAEAQKDPRSSPLTLRQASATKLPFSDSSFEYVVSVLVFHRMPPSIKRKAISEVARVLKPGGQFILADLGGARSFFWRPLGCFLASTPLLEGIWKSAKRRWKSVTFSLLMPTGTAVLSSSYKRPNPARVGLNQKAVQSCAALFYDRKMIQWCAYVTLWSSPWG